MNTTSGTAVFGSVLPKKHFGGPAPTPAPIPAAFQRPKNNFGPPPSRAAAIPTPEPEAEPEPEPEAEEGDWAEAMYAYDSAVRTRSLNDGRHSFIEGLTFPLAGCWRPPVARKAASSGSRTYVSGKLHSGFRLCLALQNLTISSRVQDWWTGESEGKRGLFPSAYVQML